MDNLHPVEDHSPIGAFLSLDHDPAEEDHTQAEADHTQAEGDHTRVFVVQECRVLGLMMSLDDLECPVAAIVSSSSPHISRPSHLVVCLFGSSTTRMRQWLLPQPVYFVPNAIDPFLFFAHLE